MTPITANAIILSETQPWRWPSEKIVMMQYKKTINKINPYQSKRGFSFLLDLGITKIPVKNAKNNSGSGIKNICRQLKASITIPPSNGPTPIAKMPPPVNIASANPRRAAG